VSRDGQEEQCTAPPEGAVIVATFPMPAGSVFDWHAHTEHQLAWAASGVLTVRTSSAAWVFVAAFRRETGLTPAAYFRNPD
jgi:quercetin dioxygenase-like cupin family protein